MSRAIGRRALLLAWPVALLAGCAQPTSARGRSASSTPRASRATEPREAAPQQLDLTDLPAGVYGVWGVLDGRAVVHDPTARVRMCSTMKLPLVALTLREHARGNIDTDRPISWSPSEIIGHSPFTTEDADRTATIEELCAATARLSDNTAANLLIDQAGGLPALNEFTRSLGDDVTRFDRYETAMNGLDGDLDTSTARAFGSLALAISESLSTADRRTLFSWLPGRDGRRIAAAAPADIDLVHKTGTSGDGVLNDVAILIADGRVAGALAVFTDSPSNTEDVVVEIARRSFSALST